MRRVPARRTGLLEIQEDLPALLGDSYLSSYPENGWLWVDVIWDDGTWQDAADTDYGEDVVVIRSAMREVAGLIRRTADHSARFLV